jgi:C-terminal duplication domain of Friend of PRMT1
MGRNFGGKRNNNNSNGGVRRNKVRGQGGRDGGNNGGNNNGVVFQKGNKNFKKGGNGQRGRGGNNNNNNKKFGGPGNGDWKRDRAPESKDARDKKMLDGMDKGMDNYWNKDPVSKAEKLTGDLQEFMNKANEDGTFGYTNADTTA